MTITVEGAGQSQVAQQQAEIKHSGQKVVPDAVPAEGGGRSFEIAGDGAGQTGDSAPVTAAAPNNEWIQRPKVATTDAGFRFAVTKDSSRRPQAAASATSVPAVPDDSVLDPGVRQSRVASFSDNGALEPASNESRLPDIDLAQPQQQPDSASPDAGYSSEVDAAELERRAKERTEPYRAQGLQTVSNVGASRNSVPATTLSRANQRFKAAKKLIQDKVARALKLGGKFRDNAFYDDILSMSKVPPHCVSIGSYNLKQALLDPSSTLLDIVNRETGLQLEVQACIDDISILVDAINMSNIEVVLSKSPVNIKGSVQVRTLRAHYGRGIGLHPTQTKAYNADFDGDPAVISLDRSQLAMHSRAMTHLIDPDGKASIDPDFFPLDYIGTSRKDREELMRSLEERNFAWAPGIVRYIVDAYIDACNKKDWVGLLRAIDGVASRNSLIIETGMRQEELASRILNSIYDYSCDRRGYTLKLEWASVVENYDYVKPDNDTPQVIIDLMEVVDDISKGKPAMNFQDFTIWFNRQYGDLHGVSVNGKNIPFRLLADFAKAIKRTDLISVGSPIKGLRVHELSGKVEEDQESTVTIYELWQLTCSAGVSKRISGRMHMGSDQISVKTQVKTRVLSILADGSPTHTPIPVWTGNRDEDAILLRRWLDQFRRVYNREARMLNMSKVALRAGMRIEREGVGRYDGFSSFDDSAFCDAFIEVFGDYSMYRLFKSVFMYSSEIDDSKENNAKSIVRRYQNMSLAEFSMRNELDWASERTGTDRNGNPIYTGLSTMISRRISRNEFMPMDIVMKIADTKSRKFGDYNKQWLEATDAFFGKVSIDKIIEKLDAGKYDAYAADMLELLHLMSPRMFAHFGMDSPRTFANSEWGKKLSACKTVDEFRSVLLSMQLRYRMSRMSGLLREMQSIADNAELYENWVERYDAAEAVMLSERKALGSSSVVWETIMREQFGDVSGFRQLLESRGEKIGKFKPTSKFWKSADPSSQYDLVNFLLSSASYDDKMSVLYDVVRLDSGMHTGIDKSHMMGMLAHNPDPMFAGSKFEMDSGISSMVDAVRDSVNKVNSYRSPNEVARQAESVISAALMDPAGFEEELSRFASDPGYHIYVDTIFAADAISSVYEKAFADSEKNSQQTLVNGYFESISLQKSGGFYTHLQQTDNAVVNVVGFDQLTNFDIVRILGDPSIELHGYDEFGAPCVWSRKSLCGGDTIEDVIDYLQANPSVALACRRHMTGIMAGKGKNGMARLVAAPSEPQEVSYVWDNPGYHIFSLLNDRPRFLAIAALATPTQGDVARNLSSKVNKNINDLCLFIDFLAGAEKMGDIPSEVDKFFNLDGQTLEGAILSIMKQGAFDEFEISEDDRISAKNVAADIVAEIEKCVGIISRDKAANPSIWNRFASAEDWHSLSRGIDKSSFSAYFDARQQMNGARTDKMISVEGSETKKNLALKEYLRHRPDRFMTIIDDDGSPKVVEVPRGTQAADLTLEHSVRKQIGSICKFLEAKREKGAETFNLKAKKFGDDNTNSIIKYVKYGTRKMFDIYKKGEDEAWSLEDGSALRTAIESAGSKDEAIPLLAEALMKADARLKYIDIGKTFQLSDYYNRADLMLLETVDSEGKPTVVIRTMEQLAVAMRNRLSDDAIASENSQRVFDELSMIEQTVGGPDDVMYDPSSSSFLVNRVRQSNGIGSFGRLERALRPYSSSVERNYTLVVSLFKKIKQEPRSRKEIEKISDNMMNRLMKSNPKAAVALDGFAYPKSYLNLNIDKKGKASVEGSLHSWESRTSVYDYIGRPYDRGFEYIFGPQSLALIDKAGYDDAIEKCKAAGITVAFSDFSLIPDKYVEDAILIRDYVDAAMTTAGDPLWILPFFDMRLNGAASDPVVPKPGVFPFQKDNVITSVEDTTFEIRSGDAAGFATQECLDRIEFNIDGVERFNIFDLFPTVIGTYPNGSYKLELADPEEIAAQVYKGVNGAKATVDYGMIPENSNFEQEKKRFDIRFEEYMKRYRNGEVGSDSFITGECTPDSIVGFVKITSANGGYAFAPIIPFHIEKSGKVPDLFKITGRPVKDGETASYTMPWRFTGDMKGRYIKFFEGIGASNKLMVDGTPIRSRSLRNGTPVDMMYSSSSVSSRLFPKNKRLATIITMLMVTRTDPAYAYNFGAIDGSFPNNPEFKQAFADGRPTLSMWKELVESNPDIRYYKDDEDINSVVKWLVDRCLAFDINPTVLLATRNSQGLYPPMYTEFEAFLDTGYNFQNSLMHLMSKMCPGLCPSSIEGDSSKTLFIPVGKDRDSDDYGVLQMLVPHFDNNGKMYEVAENVYMSFGFFGDPFSGYTTKVNTNAAETGIDNLNVASDLNGFTLAQVLAYGRAGMSSVPSMMHVEMSWEDLFDVPSRRR